MSELDLGQKSTKGYLGFEVVPEPEPAPPWPGWLFPGRIEAGLLPVPRKRGVKIHL